MEKIRENNLVGIIVLYSDVSDNRAPLSWFRKIKI